MLLKHYLVLGDIHSLSALVLVVLVIGAAAAAGTSLCYPVECASIMLVLCYPVGCASIMSVLCSPPPTPQAVFESDDEAFLSWRESPNPCSCPLAPPSQVHCPPPPQSALNAEAVLAGSGTRRTHKRRENRKANAGTWQEHGRRQRTSVVLKPAKRSWREADTKWRGDRDGATSRTTTTVCTHWDGSNTTTVETTCMPSDHHWAWW